MTGAKTEAEEAQVALPMNWTDRGQSFHCEALIDHVRKDGEPTKLAVVVTRCAECGVEVRTKTTLVSAQRWPVRRCREHKRPGVKVQ